MNGTPPPSPKVATAAAEREECVQALKAKREAALARAETAEKEAAAAVELSSYALLRTRATRRNLSHTATEVPRCAARGAP